MTTQTKVYKVRATAEENGNAKQSKKSELRQIGIAYTQLEQNIEAAYAFLQSREYQIGDSHLSKAISRIEDTLAKAILEDVKVLEACKIEAKGYIAGQLGETIKSEVSAARYEATRTDAYLSKIEKIRSGKADAEKSQNGNGKAAK